MLHPARYSVGVLSDDDGDTIVRFRTGIPDDVRANLPRQFIIEWEFRQSAASGIPSPDELAEANRFGDAIVDIAEAHGDALLALVTTGNSVREWYYYCADPLLLQDRLNAFASGQSFPITIHAGLDPNWDAYSHFTASFSADG